MKKFIYWLTLALSITLLGCSHSKPKTENKDNQLLFVTEILDEEEDDEVSIVSSPDGRICIYSRNIQTRDASMGWSIIYDVKDNGAVYTYEGLKAVISLGYGATQGVQHPQKKTIDDVTINKTNQPLPEWFIKGVEAALLAPTAVNQQKFAFILNADQSVQAQTKFSLIGYTHLDLGIVKCHFELASGRVI